MSQLITKPNIGDIIGQTEKGQPVYANDVLQTYLDEIQQQINSLLLGDAIVFPSYTVSTVPDADLWSGGAIYVTDETGGAVLAFVRGSDWRRVTDGNIIS